MATFKGKIGVSALLVVLAVTVLLYLAVIPSWAKRVREQAQDDVQRATALVGKIQSLRAYDLVALAQQIAQMRELVRVVRIPEEFPRRQEVFKEINAIDRLLREGGRKAHFFAVLDKTGAVVARDLSLEDMYGEKLPYASIKRALAGRATSDVWIMKDRMMRAAVAPLTDQGQVVGAVAIAYDFTTAEAREDAALVGTHVIYVMDNSVRASSFSVGQGEDAIKIKVLSKELTSAEGSAHQALAQGKPSKPFLMDDVQGSAYVAAVAPLPDEVWILGVQLSTRILDTGKRAEIIGGTSQHLVGMAVLANLDDRLAPVTRARYFVGLFGLLVLLAVFVVKWFVTRHFVDAEDRLELGVSEIISGNLDYTFDTFQEFEGLANALNVMLARLLGRPEPGESADDDQSWRADVIAVDAMPAVNVGVDVQRLAAEPEAAYYARIHGEYVAAREAAKLSVEGITLESLTQKLRANEAMLKARHKCHLVRFVVSSGSGRVSLQPIRIG
ncbi:MAG: cache domain-containing protein [Proteobacteria bacterium]|nr:cache domain-containing protein [Pseudomonadota bacterium]